MNKHLNYWLALALLLPALNACHDDNTMPGEEPGTAGTPTVVSVSIGGEPDTRAQVTYGTKDPEEGEYFMWNAGDKFKAYDITTAEAGTPPTAYLFKISDTYNEAQPSKQADFSCADFPANNGDKIAAFYAGSFGSVATVTDATHGKGIQAVLQKSLRSQSQTATPGHADLKHLQTELCMYAIGYADGSGSVSPLSFHHLSALFRITIRNQKSEEAKIKYTGISFPESEKIICDKKKVTVWNDNTVEYEVADNDKYHSTGNYLESTNGQNFATIAPGSSYDCFIAAMPVAEGNTASSITIGVMFADNTVKSLTIDGFTNVEIKAGTRYWFDLTIKADGTLVQTFKTDYTWYTSNMSATAFSISTPGELRALVYLVRGTEEALSATDVSGPVSFQGKTISLAGDIDLGDEAWMPIGKDGDQPFKGTFEGGGHHISGLNVNGTDPRTGTYGGLFSEVSGGTVRNLRVSGKVGVGTGMNKGGIVGSLSKGGTVENCIFSGDISGHNVIGGIAGTSTENSRIAGCYMKGNVTATADVAGGIVGTNSSNSTLTDCYSEAEVKVPIKDAGGIAGKNLGGTITYCYATGKVSGKLEIGGIVGYQNSYGTVTGCIALNPGITRTEGTEITFGRIEGENQGSITVTSCAAFSGMKLTDAGDTDFYATATGKHGDDLSAAACLAKDTYTSRGFTAATASDASGWAFDDTATPWTYLPWNKAFETFSGITAADYRITVPAHLNGGGAVN